MVDLDTMQQLSSRVATNFDHTYKEDVAKTLKTQPCKVYAQYSGWNFCGYVWHNGQNFVCQVWVFGSPCEEIEAEDIEDLMKKVSEEYGSA